MPRKEIDMRAFLIAAAIAFPMAASAACHGTGAFQNCMDNQGNTYSVQRYGNTTQMQGYTPKTAPIGIRPAIPLGT